jgi:multidrug efflux system membrane fusion protein
MLSNAKTQLARFQLLLSEDSIARSNVDDQAAAVAQLEGALKVDRATIDSAKLNLIYTRVTAPINGRVGLRLVDAGNMVSASSQTGLVVITEVEPIAVLFTVPEDTLRLLLPKIRDKVDLPVDVFDRTGLTHLATGKVQTLDNQIDASTGTVRIKAVFDNKDHLLFPAQFVNIQVLADTKRSQVVVPAVAVQHGPQTTFVYTIKDGKAVVRPVTVGLVDGDRATILSGLDAGEQVVTDSTDRLRDGSPIEIRTPGASGGNAGQRGQGRGQGQGRGTHQRPTQ